MQYYRTIERTFPAEDSRRLTIRTRSGELTIIGEDREDIALAVQLAVDAGSEHEGQEALDSIKVPLASAGGGVEVGPPEFEDRRNAVVLLGIRLATLGSGGTRVNMVARVPRTCAVQAEQRSGPLHVSGLRAALRAASRSGPSELAEIEGNVDLDSRSGAIEVRRISGDLAVDSRSGRVEVEGVGGRAVLRSRSGTVLVRDIGGDLAVESRSGRVQIEDARGAVEVRAHSGSVEFRGKVQQPVDIELFNGHVKLAVTRDSSFFMDAETMVGSIRSELPVDYLERPPEDAPVVRVRTRNGAVRVVMA